MRDFCKAKIIRDAELKVYKGAPHGLTSTHKDQFNSDLLAFLKAPVRKPVAASTSRA